MFTFCANLILIQYSIVSSFRATSILKQVIYVIVIYVIVIYVIVIYVLFVLL